MTASLCWHSVNDKLPELGVEVLVWIDGHRGPSERNNFALVAYRTKGMYDDIWL